MDRSCFYANYWNFFLLFVKFYAMIFPAVILDAWFAGLQGGTVANSMAAATVAMSLRSIERRCLLYELCYVHRPLRVYDGANDYGRNVSCGHT